MTEADQQFFKWVEDHNDWYERESNWWKNLLTFCKALTFVSGIASVVVAATSTVEFFAGWGDG